MISAGLAFSAVGFGALAAEAGGQWYRTGEASFLPIAFVAGGASLCCAGFSFLILTGEILQ